MFARSFLSKVLNFSKSSRIVLVVIVVFSNASIILAENVSKQQKTPKPLKATRRFNSVLTQRPVSSHGRAPLCPAPFTRTPSWPG
ncbi:hypothetical protein A3J41_02295 [candidate division TM6 bacterium RIFCSPHIGHO2_12_FULL_38_8]|nr:MAG: hypothetical protein A3J41_02295 [candidate division TM6 bacterium RIFCSPHIGHO2_12_FULL_38_8]